MPALGDLPWVTALLSSRIKAKTTCSVSTSSWLWEAHGSSWVKRRKLLNRRLPIIESQQNSPGIARQARWATEWIQLLFYSALLDHLSERTFIPLQVNTRGPQYHIPVRPRASQQRQEVLAQGWAIGLVLTQTSWNHLVSHLQELWFPGRFPNQLPTPTNGWWHARSEGSRTFLRAIASGRCKFHISGCCMEIVSLLCMEKLNTGR